MAWRVTPPAAYVVGKPECTYTLLSVMDMESSVSASLDISLSLALVAGAKTQPEPTWYGFTGSLLLKDHSTASPTLTQNPGNRGTPGQSHNVLQASLLPGLGAPLGGKQGPQRGLLSRSSAKGQGTPGALTEFSRDTWREDPALRGEARE